MQKLNKSSLVENAGRILLCIVEYASPRITASVKCIPTVRNWGSLQYEGIRDLSILAVSSDMAPLTVVEFLKSVMVTNLHHQSCQAFVVAGFGAHCTLNAGKRKTLGGVLGARSQGVLNSSRCNLTMVRVFPSIAWYLCILITRA